MFCQTKTGGSQELVRSQGHPPSEEWTWVPSSDVSASRANRLSFLFFSLYNNTSSCSMEKKEISSLRDRDEALGPFRGGRSGMGLDRKVSVTRGLFFWLLLEEQLGREQEIPGHWAQGGGSVGVRS